MRRPPIITMRRQNTIRPKNTKRLHTTHTLLMDTINTQFITGLKPQNSMPNSAIVRQHQPFPSTEPGKRTLLKWRSFSADVWLAAAEVGVRFLRSPRRGMIG